MNKFRNISSIGIIRSNKMWIILLKIAASFGMLCLGFFIGTWCGMQSDIRKADNQVKAGYMLHKSKLYKIEEVK